MFIQPFHGTLGRFHLARDLLECNYIEQRYQQQKRHLFNARRYGGFYY
jgi:hypothetical protein